MVPSSRKWSMTEIQHRDDRLEIAETLPLLPLRDVVVFPNMIVPLVVGRSASIASLHEAMTRDELLFVTAQRSAQVTEPQEEDLFRIGVVARLLQLLPLPDGTHKVLLEGLVRARLSRLVNEEDCAHAKVQLLTDVEEVTPEIEALHRSVSSQFARYVQLNQRVPDEALTSVLGIEEASRFADTVAAHIVCKVPVKQGFLEGMDLVTRFRALSRVLNEELEILQIERRLEGEVHDRVHKTQKEAYLTERLKQIRRELGQEGAAVDDLAAAIEEAKMGREAQEVAFRELDRLARMPALSPEAAIVRTYLETLCGMPWRKRTRDRLDLARVEAQLDTDHYGLVRVKERILEYLAVMKLTRSVRGPVLCLAGPPGVGKTSLGRSIAGALGRKFVRVSLGGVRDEAEIRGHRRTYLGAMPGRIIQSLRRCGSSNPVFLLDELDKVGTDFRGDPASALLEALDPEQNHAFSDHYLEVPFDLSKVLFITTANVLHTIPAALRDRLEVIQLPGYLDHEKQEIARHFLLPKQLQEHGIDAAQLEVTDAALCDIIQLYTRESGVRHLEREIGKLCRKVARVFAEAGPVRASGRGTRGKKARTHAQVRVDRVDLETYLSVPPYSSAELPETAEVGVTTGLAWTSTGGEILPIEVTMMGGTGELILTGHLGDVMKESARTAFSYVRSISRTLGAKSNFFDGKDVHIHVPEGAIPKDGPSAGLAIATALASLVSGAPVDRRVAMTGEITLRGKALPVGGLSEKAVAALRAGAHTILIPQRNAKDVAELPQHVRDSLRIECVDDMEEVLAHALQSPSRSRTRTRRRTTPTSSYTH
jgi:ATP-dependent Lon protease